MGDVVTLGQAVEDGEGLQAIFRFHNPSVSAFDQGVLESLQGLGTEGRCFPRPWSGEPLLESAEGLHSLIGRLVANCVEGSRNRIGGRVVEGEERLGHEQEIARSGQGVKSTYNEPMLRTLLHLAVDVLDWLSRARSPRQLGYRIAAVLNGDPSSSGGGMADRPGMAWLLGWR